jgi:hypothetical protein
VSKSRRVAVQAFRGDGAGLEHWSGGSTGSNRRAVSDASGSCRVGPESGNPEQRSFNVGPHGAPLCPPRVSNYCKNR